MIIVRSLSVLVCLPFLCGCLEVDEKIKLSGDGSGEVQLTVVFPELGIRWLPEKPTARWIKPWLPEDVKLVSFEEQKSKITVTDPQGKQQSVDALTYKTSFAFKDANELSRIRVRPDDRNQIAASGGATPGKESAMMMVPRKKPNESGPFQQVSLVNKEGVLHFRRVVQAAQKKKDVEASMMKTPGSDATPRSFDLGNSSHTITIRCPGKVVEHNAHAVHGNTLTWKFKIKELQDKQDRDWVVEFKCKLEEEQ